MTSFAEGLGSNGPYTGGTSTTIYGMNFGSNDPCPTITLRRVCQTTSWITSSSLTCLTDSVTTSRMETSTRVGGGAYAHTGSFVALFTFDAPVVTTFAPVNVPSTGGSAVSLQGMNFGTVDYTATSEISGLHPDPRSLCHTTAWSTNSYVLCRAPSGFNAFRTISVTVGAAGGSRQFTLTYNAPVVTFANPINFPAMAASVGMASMTVFGLNFGVLDITPSLATTGGPDMCQTTGWTANTAVRCQPALLGVMSQRYVVAYGNGGLNPAGGALNQGTNGAYGAHNFAVTYDAPIITWSTPANLPTTTKQDALMTVTISGINFGYTDSTPESYIGVSYCQTTTWTSATNMQCQAVEGSGPARSIIARLFQGAGSGKYWGTRLASFTFDGMHGRARSASATSCVSDACAAGFDSTRGQL